MAKLIDPMSVAYSPARGQKVVDADQASIINGFKSLLPAVGWTKTANLKATATVSYPTGFPFVDGGTITPKRTVGCQATPFLSVAGVGFQLYDPGRETPPGLASCIFVPMDVTAGGSIANLATAVSTGTDFNATVITLSATSYVLALEAKTGGPEWNFLHVAGDGRWGTIASDAGNTVGGGYTFESAPEASVYQVSITGVLSVFGQLSFVFTLDGGPAQYILATNQYRLVANGYGFLMQSPDKDGIFCMAPAKPAGEGFDDAAYAVFVLGPGTFRDATYWYGHGGPITTALDTAATTFSNTGGWPRLLALRAPGPPLFTPAGKPVIIAAYVMFGTGPLSGASVVGKLWDCAVVSDVITHGATIDGQPFVTVSSQDGASGQTASSLLMFAPAPVPDPAPPTPQPPYPETQPSQRNGTCNLFGAGVTALSGSFTGLPHLSPITIDGHPYLIDSVTDATHLTLTAAATIASNVKWTVP